MNIFAYSSDYAKIHTQKLFASISTTKIECDNTLLEYIGGCETPVWKEPLSIQVTQGWR
jgi:hypothetical protein